jgi:regulator of nucleoside diphosphate kinase
MNSLVEFVDERGKTRLARLTHPWAPRTTDHGISITSLLGAGLLGLAEGQAVLWPDRTGEMHPLKVNRIGRPATPIEFTSFGKGNS